MKKYILYTILFPCLIVFSCLNKDPDYGTKVSDSEIYSFMNYAMEDLKIVDSVNIQSRPFSLFQKELDRNYLKITDFTILDSEDEKYSSSRILLPSDTTFIVNQNNRLVEGFLWDKQKLGFNENSVNPMKVDLSLPYFSSDKKTVLLFERYYDTSAFMSGGSTLWKFVKTGNRWKKESIMSVVN